jgi:hypothetical protein
MATRFGHSGRNDQCAGRRGGGLVPPLGCSCDGNAHTCTPVICPACDGTGRWIRSVPVTCPTGESDTATHGHS